MSKELWSVERPHYQASFVVEDGIVVKAPPSIAGIGGMNLPDAFVFLLKTEGTKIQQIL